jgi:hypothetical protein
MVSTLKLPTTFDCYAFLDLSQISTFKILFLNLSKFALVFPGWEANPELLIFTYFFPLAKSPPHTLLKGYLHEIRLRFFSRPAQHDMMPSDSKESLTLKACCAGRQNLN